MNKGINVTVIIVTALIVIGILGSVALFKDKPYGDNTISVTGNSEMKFQPDNVAVYINIETRDESAKAAEDRNSEISEDVVSGLIALGIDREDIQTQGYNIYPEYDWSSNRQELIGYVASNQLKLTSEEFSVLGNVVDVVIDNGGLISYINFELSNEKLNEYKAVVLEEASKDATVKAEAVANGLGKSLGKLVSVSTSNYDYRPYPLYYAEDAAVASSEDVKAEFAGGVTPSDLDVSASVSVVYELK